MKRSIVQWVLYLFNVCLALAVLWPGGNVSFRQWLTMPLHHPFGWVGIGWPMTVAFSFIFYSRQFKDVSLLRKYCIFIAYGGLATLAMKNCATAFCTSLICRVFLGVVVRVMYVYWSLTVLYAVVFKDPYGKGEGQQVDADHSAKDRGTSP
jgi:hypothetical protein